MGDRGKRGLGHIEAILSFVIFVGFLIFAFFFFSPFSGNRVLDSSIDYTFREINDNVSIFMESYSVVIDFNEPDPIGILIDMDIENANVKIENRDGIKLDSGFNENTNIVSFNRNNEDFVVVRFSEDFVDGGVNGGTLMPEENYTVSSSNRKEISSEQKFLILNQSYYERYEDLKKDFNLPNRVDFAFTVDFGDSEQIIAERPIPEELEVIASQERIEIIRADGDIVFADLIMRVW